MTADDHRSHRADHHQGVSPAWQMRHQAETALVPGVRRPNARQFGYRQQGNHRQHGNDRNILEQQHRESAPAPLGFAKSFLVQGLQHNGGGRQREDKANGDGGLPLQPHPPGNRHSGSGGEHHLQAAQAQQTNPHGPEGFRVQLHAHQKQHHDHTKLGKMLNGCGFLAHQPRHRPDDDTGHQIPQYRPQTQALRQWHRDNSGGQIDKRLDKVFGHYGPIRSAKDKHLDTSWIPPCCHPPEPQTAGTQDC